MNKEKWVTQQTKLLDSAKFLKQGTKVIVDVTFTPIEREVEGKYGKRNMHIIRTVEYGLIYLSDLQFLHVCDVLAPTGFEENVTVEI